MVARDLALFADYRQVYAWDAECTGPDPAGWSTDDMLRRVVFGGDHLVIFTVASRMVPVRVEILPEAPPLELFGWDQIVDGALRSAAGALVVLGCTDPEGDAARLPLAPGIYRVRVSMAGLDSADGEATEAEDRYRLQLWPGPWRETVVRRMQGTGED